MKTVLAYGDSVTWGLDAARGGARHAYEDRWTSVLEAGLNGQARVIAEGLPGRTTMFDWPPEFWDNKNGAALLPAILESHRPLDLVIVALLGNDLVPWVGKTAAEAAEGMRHVIGLIRSVPPGGERLPIPILMVGTYEVDPTVPLGDEAGTARFREQAALLPDAYRALAAELGVTYFDARGVVSADRGADGLHLDAANTRTLGSALVPIVVELLEQRTV